jgi:hypothetical protein
MNRLAPTHHVPDALALEEGLPFDEVEQRIGLAYAAAGLKHRVIAFYLRDVDARGIQQLSGYPTTAQWAAHRFGMSRREARDLLAAGKALVELTEIDRAFAEGHLCWSKVRELVKVAVPEHEQKWLEMALGLHIDEGLPEIRLRSGMTMPPMSTPDGRRCSARSAKSQASPCGNGSAW